ncbi:MAG TPA: hypothetical protein VMC04_01230 [Verrucomicrobiae bacterium]|jgi:hypothetical protein|nr:hypothetical protein [Verrucomicrobiae bacterium]
MRNAMKCLVLAAMAVLALAAGSPVRPAAALSATSSVDARIRLDWQVGTTRGGRPVIQGYVYNDYGRPASDVQLLVESLDASGAVIGRNVGFVRGVVQLNDRTYFEVPIKVTGTSYRVSVTGLDWRGGGGGA